ncbi:MAG: peptidylprolyl isomerase [Bacteroidia bacterium]|nr:peptidylprolyl isomerase [Bacteroidia bacterium]
MKINISKILIVCLLFLNVATFGQSIQESIIKINTIDEANNFIKTNSTYESELLTISSDVDSSEISKILFEKKKGEIITFKNYIYKIIESSSSLTFRVSYIYLNGDELTKMKIDSLRDVIIKKYNDGVSFKKLVKQYNMDNNKTFGDLGWFSEGMMVKDFETAVKKHRQNDLFTVDIPDHKWYYVVLKTFDDRVKSTLVILQVKNNK